MNDIGAKNLRAAILIQAIKDYKQALLDKDTETVEECEQFFHSEWFNILSRLDANTIIYKIKKQVEDELNDKGRTR